MQFNWEGAIGRNFAAMERIVARLYALAGVTSLRPVVDTLPRGLRIRILSILRPAEFALRRLIAIAAGTREYAFHPIRPAGKPRAAENPPSGAPARPGAEPAFALFDPLKRYGDPWLTPEEIAALHAPSVPFAPEDRPPDEPVDAVGLCRRIAALRHALDDLDGQAMRLARWRARRDAEAALGGGVIRTRPRRWMPMRPGRPPGWKRRPKTEIAELLRECHGLARDAWSRPDTS